jgi:hypothetical protein
MNKFIKHEIEMSLEENERVTLNINKFKGVKYERL